jgi:putative SOS response-associated peptidase YedK
MCGRFSNTLHPQEIGRQLGNPLGVAITESAGTGAENIAPTDPVLGIVASDGQRQARVLRWDLVPSYAKTVDPPKSGPRKNARVERLRSGQTYFGVKPDPVHRVLIVATEFDEWVKGEQERKVKPAPFGFSVDGNKAFCFAGLWTVNQRVPDGPVASATIITCDASTNGVVSPIHHRMPVILPDPEQWKAWLDPNVSQEEALTMCEPLPTERMSVRPLPQTFNNSHNKSRETLWTENPAAGTAAAPDPDEPASGHSQMTLI